jgi:hypothetical protein
MDEDWQEELIAAGVPSDSETSDNDAPGMVCTHQRESVGQRKHRKIKDDLYASGIAGERP